MQTTTSPNLGQSTQPEFDPSNPGKPGPLNRRRQEARKIRQDAAKLAFEAGQDVTHQNNGDEQRFPNFIGNYSKGLPHNQYGEVEPAAYQQFLHALRTGNPADFEQIPLKLGRKLTNPQAGLAFDLEGPDAWAVTIPKAPSLDSAETAGEMTELYWMALLKDVSFTDYASNDQATAAANDLSNLSDFRGPKENGRVTPATLFRGITPGDLVGPYLSQFLLTDIPYGSLKISQRQKTVVAQMNYMTDYNAWLDIQNGLDRTGQDQFDPVPRYIRNIRDLGQYVHVDALYEAYLNACLILLGMNARLDSGNPYNMSKTQDGFGTFGGPHILSLVTEVATRALKAVWFQKWFVHRRLRPEAYGGLVHNKLVGDRPEYPIPQELLDSQAVQRIYSTYGSYLLPMNFPEGSPTHPAYGAGHATVAGACVTILKAWFDESDAMPNPMVPNAEGTELVPYTGDDAGQLTVGGELNKVAANISIGRNGAGVHWRSDYTESIRLGEKIALGVLREQALTYNEKFSFTLTTFDGQQVTIAN